MILIDIYGSGVVPATNKIAYDDVIMLATTNVGKKVHNISKISS
jgi:hypothetical protein